MGLRSWCLPVGCPGGIKDVTLAGDVLQVVHPGLTIQWQWAAAM